MTITQETEFCSKPNVASENVPANTDRVLIYANMQIYATMDMRAIFCAVDPKKRYIYQQILFTKPVSVFSFTFASKAYAHTV